MSKLWKFIKAQPVLAASFVAAVASAFGIPPDGKYPGYINRAVLIELFALMAAVAGFRSAGVFDSAASAILRKAGSIRRLGAVMILVCFISAMLVTNDVALIAFVPLTLLIFERIPDEKSRILIVVLETVAANMGSMLTPVGNPQNLYLYDRFGLTASVFVKTMLPAGAVGLAGTLLLTLLLPRTPCSAPETAKVPVNKPKCAACGFAFVICLLTVFRVIPDYICLVACLATILVCDFRLLKKVDYALLATFLCFFIFVGNIARVEAVEDFFSRMLGGREIIVAAALSQAISNVPAAVMLAGFTDEGAKLMLGADLGGLGTVVASLASLISFQFYRQAKGAKTGRYLLVFSAVNYGLLAVLLGFEFAIGNV